LGGIPELSGVMHRICIFLNCLLVRLNFPESSPPVLPSLVRLNFSGSRSWTVHASAIELPRVGFCYQLFTMSWWITVCTSLEKLRKLPGYSPYNHLNCLGRHTWTAGSRASDLRFFVIVVLVHLNFPEPSPPILSSLVCVSFSRWWSWTACASITELPRVAPRNCILWTTFVSAPELSKVVHACTFLVRQLNYWLTARALFL
jgi:hypothetical protein